MVLEALKTSEIEGELILAEDIRSSIRLQLKPPHTKASVTDSRAKGIADLMLDVRHSFCESLTKEKLFEWHTMVMADSNDLQIGCWRKDLEPMQIISGPIGREKVHYEAPPSGRLDSEMDAFLDWFNRTQPTQIKKELPGPIRASVAHLYFESIHPFTDGNGRIGRAIAEKALSQDIGSPVLFSLSNTIQSSRKDYYLKLHDNSGYSLEITDWIEFFVDVIYKSQLESKDQILFVLKKSHFWRKFEDSFNPRQEKAIQRILKEGPSGFKGGLSAQKYMTITGCSKATATRDLAGLLEMGCLYRLPGKGPNTRYDLEFG